MGSNDSEKKQPQATKRKCLVKRDRGGSVMKKEFIVWGVAPNTTEEQVLYTKAQTLADAHAIASYLISDKGCTDTRVQVIDFTKKPDFTNIFN